MNTRSTVPRTCRDLKQEKGYEKSEVQRWMQESNCYSIPISRVLATEGFWQSHPGVFILISCCRPGNPTGPLLGILC